MFSRIPREHSLPSPLQAICLLFYASDIWRTSGTTPPPKNSLTTTPGDSSRSQMVLLSPFCFVPAKFREVLFQDKVSSLRCNTGTVLMLWSIGMWLRGSTVFLFGLGNMDTSPMEGDAAKLGTCLMNQEEGLSCRVKNYEIPLGVLERISLFPSSEFQLGEVCVPKANFRLIVFT